MKHSRLFRIATLAVALSFVTAFTHVLAAPAAKTEQAAPVAPSPEDLSNLQADGAGNVSGNLAELQDMIQGGRVTELRATRNASYGAKLYFLPQEMLYYVALQQETRLWRVVKTQDEARAESVYSQFARKTFELADGEIRRTRLQAQTALLERVIAVLSNRASRLSADLALAQQQDSQVSERQQKLQAESASLQGDKLEAERKLRALQQQVDQLQRATEAGLTSVTVVPSR
ncbi:MULTISPECIES: DUF2968 domain-containing protein [unclassified Caballeronia]|uniref:DUF2968 domain-containing protein n=1 Tax=unclassified Caballeronia TaxID=2646786 RepID=UPI002857936B|nr:MULTISPECIES: DUF2968 domain-containing protein [unclassified Caballeronia]MDR5737758.1 DUF2968 domain-containing protein [Caballeronia sp. LZ016]MDR5809705.1 DUF2968 domain-containing protein [Caballeronia sp. LZ019]